MLAKLQMNRAPVVITGGSIGIGKATADALAQMGAHVILVARRQQPLDEAQADIRARGGLCDTFAADVSKEDEVARLAAWAGAKFGAIKALVNNAGTNLRMPLTELPSAKWHEIVAINLDSIFYMCRAFIPLMLPARSPSIVNVASSFGLVGSAQSPVYCATKGAVVNLTRQLAIDYGPQGLRVNTLCPGPTLSPRIKSYVEQGLSNSADVIANVMLKRRAECEEVGDVAAFLVSDAASFVHGAAIVVDGGQTVH